MLRGDVGHHRPSLEAYAELDLDRVILGAGMLTIIAYTSYALAVPTFGRDLPMSLTVPFVAAAIWRYLYLVLRRNLGGTPESLLFRDRPLFLMILSWSVAVAVVLTS